MDTDDPGDMSSQTVEERDHSSEQDVEMRIREVDRELAANDYEEEENDEDDADPHAEEEPNPDAHDSEARGADSQARDSGSGASKSR